MKEHPKVDLEHLKTTGEVRFIGFPDMTPEEGAIHASPDTVDKVQLPDGNWVMNPRSKKFDDEEA